MIRTAIYLLIVFSLAFNSNVINTGHQSEQLNKAYTSGQSSNTCQQKSPAASYFQCKQNQAYAIDLIHLVECQSLMIKLAFLLYFLSLSLGIKTRIYKPPRNLQFSVNSPN
jgi:hypothetical protein